MRKFRFPIALLVVAVAILLLPIVASASNSWSKYHWNISTAQSADTPLALGNNLTTDDWNTSLGVASSDWNASVLKNGITAGSGTGCDPVLGGVEVCNALYGENGWLGIAQVWVYRGRDGHIAQALVKVNDTYFDQPQYDNQSGRDYVVCQEVGHTFGLSHQDEAFDNANLDSCMDYTDDPDGTISAQLDNRNPNQHDLDVMYEKYGHLNGVSDGGNGGGKGNNGGGNGGGKGNNGGGGAKGKKGDPPGQSIRE